MNWTLSLFNFASERRIKVRSINLNFATIQAILLKFQNIHLPINVSDTCESFADLSRRNISLIPTAFESAMSASFAGKQITWPKHRNKKTLPPPREKYISRKFMVFRQGPVDEINVKSPYFPHYCSVKSPLSAGVLGSGLQLTSALKNTTDAKR